MPEPDTHDMIRADRACIACGFNLYGQPITREDHYNLLIARCPECGQAAALQSYPAMSHWVNRFRALLSALWVSAILGALALCVMINTALTQAACEGASEQLASIIAGDFKTWNDAKAQATATTTSNLASTPAPPPGAAAFLQNLGSRWTPIDPGWRENHLDETIERAGGLTSTIDPEYLVLLIPVLILSAIFGVFWTLALLNAPRWRVTILTLAIALVTLGLTLTFNHVGAGNQMAQSIAKAKLTPIVAPRVVLAQAIAMIAAVLVARSLARMFACAALPPRSRVALSFLWTADKKPLPKSGRGR
jgi:hypothetical protein